MIAQTAEDLAAEEDVDREGDQRERGAASTEGNTIAGEMGIHDSHHRGNRCEEEQKCHETAENGTSLFGAGGVLLFEDGHSGKEGSVSEFYLQLAVHSYTYVLIHFSR